MDKKSFYISEIILGLRDEYLKINKKLEELKKLMVFDPKYNSLVYIDAPNEKKFTLVIELEERLNVLEKLISLISKKQDNTDKTEISHDFNGVKNYVSINEPSKCGVKELNKSFNKCDVIELNKFYEQCDQILHMDSAKIFAGYDKLDEIENMIMKIGYYGVNCFTTERFGLAPHISFYYNSLSDRILLTNHDNLNEYGAALKVIMETPIAVPDKYASIIENNPKSKLPIRFDEILLNNMPQKFDLEEHSDYVLAKRVKSK